MFCFWIKYVQTVFRSATNSVRTERFVKKFYHPTTCISACRLCYRFATFSTVLKFLKFDYKHFIIFAKIFFEIFTFKNFHTPRFGVDRPCRGLSGEKRIQCKECRFVFPNEDCYKTHRLGGPRGGRSICEYRFLCEKCDCVVCVSNCI